MKKLFSGIGILLAIFSAYFFLLVADKMVYITQDTIYDFILEDSSISVKELAAIIDIRYMVFVLFELAIYFVSVHSYIRRKAILSMKGA